MKAPVVLFAYNRVEHTKRVLQALSNNVGAEDTELYIYSDAAADVVEQNNVKLVRETLVEFKNDNPLKKVEIIMAEYNKGLEKSIISGVTDIINRYGKIIVLEDDIVPAPDFLAFMNGALDYYEKDVRIWSVSGYSIDSPAIRKSDKDVFVGYRGECGGGWASWADRWNKVDWLVEDFAEFMKDKRKQREFNRGGRELTSLLIKQQQGEIKSWAIRWCYQQYKESMLTVFPKHTKTTNIGFDGSGTNCSKHDYKEIETVLEDGWDYRYDINNQLMQNEFQKAYWLSYWRQQLGYYWYMLTEYEYCLGYCSCNGNYREKYKVLKPNYKEWYADPIPYEWNGQTYVFMEVYSKLKRKGYIGVSKFDNTGKLGRPKKVLEEKFHMSFPYVFEYKDSIYMIPECSDSNQIRIYRMENDIFKWRLYYQTDEIGKIVDVVSIKSEEDGLLLLGSRINEDNPHQSRLISFSLKNLDEKERISFNKRWEADEYTYDKRNGGRVIESNSRQFRVVQHSTKNIYGKFVSFNEIRSVHEGKIEEEFVTKLDLNNQVIPLASFIYRPWGIHTYGKISNIEIVDVLVQRFSIMGLFWKIYRRILKI